MEEKSTIYKISFKPARDFFLFGNNPLSLFAELRALGLCSIVAHTGAIPALAVIEPEASYIAWDILLATDKGVSAIRDVFVFVEDLSEIQITTLTEKVDRTGFPGCKRLGEILIDRGELRPEDLVTVLASQKPVGELLVEAKLVTPSQVESALAEQQVRRERNNAARAGEGVRVPAEKLDQLINLAGELVVIQERLTQVSAHARSEFVEQVRQVERLTSDLRECVLNIRMLPIGAIYGRYSRLVRDLAAELHKEVDLITHGAETELDKAVIEQLRHPLAHLISSCIEHGLELPAEREAAGKPRCGVIRMAAVRSGARAIISVQDDGRGINPDIIRSRALTLGLLKSGDELNDREVLSLIFTPRFTMGERTIGAGGREAGMDVVRTAAESMNGSVEVTSAPGKGTIFTITLPLTMAIIDGLLVRAANTHFILPLNVVEEIIELTGTGSEDEVGGSRRLCSVRGQLVPYVRLRDFFRMEGERPSLEQMVVVRMNNQPMGLVLDQVLGGHQTVIKPLGLLYREAKGLSGSTILGSGEVALIIDVPQLLYQAKMEEKQAVAGLHAGSRREGLPDRQPEKVR